MGFMPIQFEKNKINNYNLNEKLKIRFMFGGYFCGHRS